MLSHWKKCAKAGYSRPDAYECKNQYAGKEIKCEVRKKKDSVVTVSFQRGTSGLAEKLIEQRRQVEDTDKLEQILTLLEDRLCGPREIAKLATFRPSAESVHHLKVLGELSGHEKEHVRVLALRVIQRLASTRVGRVAIKQHGCLSQVERVSAGRRHPAGVKLAACEVLRTYASSSREGGRVLIESKGQSAKALIETASNDNWPPKLRESCLGVLSRYLDGGTADKIMEYAPKFMIGLVECLDVQEFEFDEEFQTEPDEEDVLLHEGLVRVAIASLCVLKKACLTKKARESALETRRITSLLVPYLDSESVDIRRNVSSVLMSLSVDSTEKLDWVYTANLIRAVEREKDRLVLENLGRFVSNLCVLEKVRSKLREVKFSDVLDEIVSRFRDVDNDDEECSIKSICEDAKKALAWDP